MNEVISGDNLKKNKRGINKPRVIDDLIKILKNGNSEKNMKSKI